MTPEEFEALVIKQDERGDYCEDGKVIWDWALGQFGYDSPVVDGFQMEVVERHPYDLHAGQDWDYTNPEESSLVTKVTDVQTGKSQYFRVTGIMQSWDGSHMDGPLVEVSMQPVVVMQWAPVK